MNKKKITRIVVIVIAVAIGILIGNLMSSSGASSHEGHQHTAEGDTTSQKEEDKVWTCSMHPQIRQNEPGKCPICGMDLIPAKSESGGSPLAFEMTEAAQKLADVQTATVKERPLTKTIKLNGQIEVDERQQYTQIAHFPGRIEKLYVDYDGAKIRRGQTIALIYSPQLVTAQEELLEAYKTREQNPAMLEAAKNKLRNWKITGNQIQEVLNKGEVRTQWPLKADFSGTVQKRMVTGGQQLQKGQSMFKIQSYRKVWAILEAYQENLNWIEEGDSATLHFSNSMKKPVKGIINYIDPEIDAGERIARVRINLSSPGNDLKPGMWLEGHIQGSLEGHNAALTIPQSAVLWTGETSYVYKIIGEAAPNQFQLQAITLGPQLNDHYVIQSGLSAGEQVVAQGTYMMDAASELNNKPSMMSPKDAAPDEKAAQSSHSSMDHSKSDKPEKKSSQPYDQWLGQWLSGYYAMKDALISSDSSKAGKAALKLHKSIMESMNAANSVPEEMNNLMKKSTQISETNTLKDQRSIFVELNQSYKKLISQYGIEAKNKVYLQFCPMANSNEGAYWLSNEEKIKNPYYGQSMLDCGSVEATY